MLSRTRHHRGGAWLLSRDPGPDVQAGREFRVRVAKERPVGVRDLAIVIDIGVFEPAGRRPILGSRFLDVIKALKETYDLVAIECADRMTGLGLAVCDRIMKQHHGHISVSNVFPSGACFLLEFPALAMAVVPA